MTTFSYAIDHVPFSAKSATAQSFSTLAPNDYKDGNFRLRRYSGLDFDKDSRQVHLRKNEAFVQSDDFNKFQGNVARKYDDLTAATIACPEFVAMLSAFADIADLPQKSYIEIHQIRIIAKDNHDASASPEGIHQDGYDRIGMFTVARHNVQGGELLFWHNKTDAAPFASLDPKAGDFCVLNDHLLWHSASDVGFADKEEALAYWDLFVLTANKS